MMVALGHFDPYTGVLKGTWIPPIEGSELPQSFYPTDQAAREVAYSIILDKGPDPSWDDWFDQLGQHLPYTVHFVSIDVAPTATPESIFTTFASAA